MCTKIYVSWSTLHNVVYHSQVKIAVHAFFLPCLKGNLRGGATCNCGVFIRVGNEVIIFNRCDSKKKNSELSGFSNQKQLSAGIHINRINAKKYQVSNLCTINICRPHDTIHPPILWISRNYWGQWK